MVTGICLRADSVGTFGFDAVVFTSLDNSGWRGRYDLDTGRLTALEDNRGNIVEDQSGLAVDRFPWAETAWTGNHVREATLLCDCDPVIDLDDNRFESESSTDIRGASGYIRASGIVDDAILELDDAAVLIRALTMTSRSRIYGERSTNVRIFYHEMASEAYWLFRDRDDVRSYGSTFDSSSRIYFYSGTRQWFYYCDFGSYGTHRQYAGLNQFYYSAWAGYSEARAEAGSGLWLVYGCDFSARGRGRNFNTNEVRQYYDAVESAASQIFRDASSIRSYYNSVTSLAIINYQGAVTTVYGSSVDSQSTLTLTGGNHYRAKLSALARITTAFNTRSVYGFGSWATTLSAANTNRGRDYFNNSLL